MQRPTLFVRRQIWLPTFGGWILLLALGCLATGWMVRHIHAFLSPDRPVGGRFLVVEGWMSPDELEQAIEAFRSGGYERIVTTGGPIPPDFERLGHASYAELAQEILGKRGVPPDRVIAVPTPASAQDRTFLSGVMVREWAKREGLVVDSLDVFSSGVHGRRSWSLYRKAFGPDVRIGILSARTSSYDPDAWWRTSVGAKTVILETISWIWTELFFRPGDPGSHEEMWGLPAGGLEAR